MQHILKEFKDVTPDEIPSYLLKMRDIQHQINLIIGAILPNKAVYRMSPKEHKEFYRQVNELLKKWLMRENMSPYAFLDFLKTMVLGVYVLIIE